MRRKAIARSDHNGTAELDPDPPFRHIVTSAAVTGICKPAGAPVSVFDPVNTSQRHGTVKGPDLDALEIRRGVPLPHTRCTRADAYRRLLERMEVGDSVVLPKRAAMGLVTHAKERGYRVAYRSLDADNAGVWRLA